MADDDAAGLSDEEDRTPPNAGAAAASSCGPHGDELSGARSSDSEDGELETFALDEMEAADTTAAQYAAGRDLQGIPWSRLQVRGLCTARSASHASLCWIAFGGRWA